MSHILSVKNLRKVYPVKRSSKKGSQDGKTSHVAVDGISFVLNEGEILGLLGPNGSGKTTTIQMLLGTLTLTSGSIYYFGKEFESNRTEVLQNISFASTYTSLPWILTIEENLEVFGRFYGMSPKESAKRFNPLLERFGILDKKYARVSSLSAGQITRLMLVKAFFINPKILLLDEPTASLDPDVSKEICEFILSERERTGLSILFTSHKMEEATQLCDRVIFLKEGKIIADDLPRKLALSTSAFRLKLTLIDDMKLISTLVERRKLPFKIDHRMIEITIDESEIPSFLNSLGEDGITYSNIRIEEPSLEEYFLQITRKKHEFLSHSRCFFPLFPCSF